MSPNPCRVRQGGAARGTCSAPGAVPPTPTAPRAPATPARGGPLPLDIASLTQAAASGLHEHLVPDRLDQGAHQPTMQRRGGERRHGRLCGRWRVERGYVLQRGGGHERQPAVPLAVVQLRLQPRVACVEPDRGEPQPGVLGMIRGPGDVTDLGDAFSVRCRGTQNCGTTSNVASRSTGYWYVIKMPASGAARTTIRLFDAAYNDSINAGSGQVRPRTRAAPSGRQRVHDHLPAVQAEQPARLHRSNGGRFLSALSVQARTSSR